MARQSLNGLSPEFTDWLKTNKVSIRRLQRNPESLGQYYQEWTKLNRRPRRQSRLRMPNLNNLDLGTIVNGVRIANEVFRTFQGFQGFQGGSGLSGLFRFLK